MKSVSAKNNVPAAAGGELYPRPLRVLMVQADRDVAKRIALVLQLQGHDLQVAFDGETALRLARGTAPDVVLLDLGLTGTDACQLARQLQHLRGGDKILFIAVSAAIPDEDRARVSAAGIHLHCPPTADP